MKKTLLIIAVALFGFITTSFAQKASGLNFLKDMTVAQAQTSATEKGKILMMDVYASWCGPCKKLSANVFPSATVESLNSKIVAYKLNAEEGEGPAYAKQYKVSAYPTLIFFKGGKEVARMVGAPLDPAEFVKAVNEKLSEASK